MDRPTTATGAAAALRDLANRDSKALPFVIYGRPGDDPLTALTRSPRDEVLAALGRPVGGNRSWSGEGFVDSLPPVLVPLPDLRTIGAVFDRTPDGDTLADWSGFPYPVGVPLDPGPRHRDTQRPRRIVLAGPEAAPSPDGSRALVVSVLTARVAAGDLDRWAAILPARPTQRVEAEAATYRAYADTAEALIPASFEWATDLDNPAVTPAFSHVPATLRGVVVRGDST